MDCTFAPVSEPSGEIVGLVEIARDLRAQLRAEDRLRLRERMATFGELTTGLAHEVGNPLANLKSGVEWLLARERSAEEQQESLELLWSEIDRLHRLVRQVLELGRWETPVLRSVAAAELLDYVAASVRVRAQNQGVEIDVSTPPELRTFKVIGDADQLKQALLNLAANALTAMPEGGMLELGLSDEGDQGCLWVRDTGSGIEPEDQPHVFELFFSRTPGGSGIGLPLVKRITDLHSGNLLLESRPGMGTTLRLLLPRASSLPGEEEAP